MPRGKVTKKNTDARKAQNRNASRAYRERRRQRLAQLGDVLDKDRGKQQPAEKPTTDASPPAHQQVAVPLNDSSYLSTGQALMAPAPSFSALGNLVQLLELPTTDRNAPSASSTQRPTSSRDESLGQLMQHLMSLRTPAVQRAIYVEQNSLYAAIMDNTLAIGCLQGMQLLFSEDGASPFHNHNKKPGAPLLPHVKSQFAAVPKDLQPVDEQITTEHHIYLNLLPFPSFRQRALQALAQDPPLFDKVELCVNISTNNGLVVWGALGNNKGMEVCRSWDMRSWEPQPWFLRKYWFLVGGWEDDMWKAARWWHAVRNERIGAAEPPQSGGAGRL